MCASIGINRVAYRNFLERGRNFGHKVLLSEYTHFMLHYNTVTGFLYQSMEYNIMRSNLESVLQSKCTGLL